MLEFAPYYFESNQLKAAQTVLSIAGCVSTLMNRWRGEQSDNPSKDLTVCGLERIIVDKQGMSHGVRGVIHSLMLHS